MIGLAEYITIKRDSKLNHFVNATNYIDPPHAILTDIDIKPSEMITTAICWVLGRRHISIPVRQITCPELLAAAQRQKEAVHWYEILIFLGMAGLMTLAREIGSVENVTNYQYLMKRWQVVCEMAGIKDIFATETISQNTSMFFEKTLEAWQKWICLHTAMRHQFLDIVLRIHSNEVPFLINTALDQVKMVLQDFGLQPVLLMDRFVNTHNRAILLPTIAQQAVDLKRAVSDLKTQHGEKFPYIMVYPLNGADRLNYLIYPDLCYAALSPIGQNKTSGLPVQKIIDSLKTTSPRYVIDKELSDEFVLDRITKKNLRILGMEPCRICRYRKEDDEDDEDDEQPARKRLRDLNESRIDNDQKRENIS